MSEGAEGAGPSEKDLSPKDLEMAGQKPKEESVLPAEEIYDLDEAVKKTTTEKRMLIRRANQELKALRKSPDMTLSDSNHEDRTEKRRKRARHKKGTPEKELVQSKRFLDDVSEGRGKDKLKTTKSPDRPPEPPELPKAEVINLEKVMEKILDTWGKTPDDITENLEEAMEDDEKRAMVFASLLPFLDAQILDTLLQDEKFRDDPEVHRLQAQVETAFAAFTDPDRQKGIKRRKDTGERVIEVTPGEEDGTPTASTGAEKGKIYYSFTPTRVENAGGFLLGFRPELGFLKTTRDVFDSLSTNTPIAIDEDFLDYPEGDPIIESYNTYVYDMMNAFTDAVNALEDENVREVIKQKLKEEKSVADDELDHVLENALTEAKRSLAMFDVLNEYDVEWDVVAAETQT
jgi:hypothetical protein